MRDMSTVQAELEAANAAGDKAKVTALLAEKQEIILATLRDAPDGALYYHETPKHEPDQE